MVKIYFATKGAKKKEVCEVASVYFKEYTLLKTTGIREGVLEPSWVLELIDSENEAVASFSNMIKWKYNQEAVLVVNIPSTHQFI